jgi:hypothetical protein
VTDMVGESVPKAPNRACRDAGNCPRSWNRRSTS